MAIDLETNAVYLLEIQSGIPGRLPIGGLIPLGHAAARSGSWVGSRDEVFEYSVSLSPEASCSSMGTFNLALCGETKLECSSYLIALHGNHKRQTVPLS